MNKKRSKEEQGEAKKTDALAHSCEIRNGELIRYYGEDSEFTVPEGVNSIGAEAFRGNKKLTDVVLGRDVTVIRRNAFRDCVKLKRISMPAGLREIGIRSAFGAQENEICHCFHFFLIYLP